MWPWRGHYGGLLPADPGDSVLSGKGVFTVALYRYATLGEAPPGFSGDAIDEALGRRKVRWSGSAQSGY